MKLPQILDLDWERLNDLSGKKKIKRNFFDNFSPRFFPVVLLRLANYFQENNWLRVAKIPSLVNFILFGLEVPARLSIGPGLVLMHTQGTVLGASTIGRNVTIYHQVTIGAKELDFAYNDNLRPTVGNGVIIGVGAKILGNVTIGDNCVIGANAVVISDVPNDCVAIGIPAKLRSNTNRLDKSDL